MVRRLGDDGSRFGRDPPDFWLYLPGLLDVAWRGPMAHLTEEMIHCRELTRSRQSLLLTGNLAMWKIGNGEPENIQREEPALVRQLVMVPGGGYRARLDSVVSPTMSNPGSSSAMIDNI